MGKKQWKSGQNNPGNARNTDGCGIGHFANILGEIKKLTTRYCVLVVDLHHKMWYNNLRTAKRRE